MFDFEELEKQGKTVIYREEDEQKNIEGWDFWAERKTPDEHVYIYYKIVTFEEAERYELENGLLD